MSDFYNILQRTRGLFYNLLQWWAVRFYLVAFAVLAGVWLLL